MSRAITKRSTGPISSDTRTVPVNAKITRKKKSAAAEKKQNTGKERPVPLTKPVKNTKKKGKKEGKKKGKKEKEVKQKPQDKPNGHLKPERTKVKVKGQLVTKAK